MRAACHGVVWGTEKLINLSQQLFAVVCEKKDCSCVAHSQFHRCWPQLCDALLLLGEQYTHWGEWCKCAQHLF